MSWSSLLSIFQFTVGMQQNENLDGYRDRLNPVKSHGIFFLEDDTSLSGLQLQTPAKCKLHLTFPKYTPFHTRNCFHHLDQYACSSGNTFSLSKLAPHGVFPNPHPRILDCTRVYPLKGKANYLSHAHPRIHSITSPSIPLLFLSCNLS